MPALQDAIVALVAVAAGLLVARRRFGLGVRTRAAVEGCEKCAAGDPCAPAEAPLSAVKAHPLKLVRPQRR